ncbi:MAG: glutathione S-transferase family protein [Burkholderiales bacterium]
MGITLYHGHGSPYGWRVWLALEHKKLDYSVKVLSFSAGDTRSPEFLKLNPRHKAPVIVDGEFVLYESSAIIEYLEECFPAPAMLPAETRQRAVARRLIREADQYFGTAMNSLVRQVFFKPQAEQDSGEIAGAADTCGAELAYLEQQLQGDFFVGALSAVDFTVYPLIALTLRIEKRQPSVPIARMIGPHLAAWMKRMEALPYFSKTYPPHWR